MIFLASYAPNGRYVMPTDHMRCLVAWTGDLGALEAVRKLLRAPNDKGSAHDTRKGRRRTKFRLPCAYLWLSPPSARSARRLRLPTIRFEQNPPAGWPSSSAAVLRSGRSVRRRRRTAGWQAKQHAIEEHGYESCLRRQLAHHHRRGRAADACCSGRRQNRAGSSR